MSPTRLVNGERVQITEEEAQEAQARWERYRDARGEPRRRKVTPDGTVLEDDVQADEERVAEEETRADRQRVKDEAAAAIQALSGNAQGQATLDLLIMISHGLGPIPLDFAKRNGWTPPWER